MENMTNEAMAKVDLTGISSKINPQSDLMGKLIQRNDKTGKPGDPEREQIPARNARNQDSA